MAVQTGMHNIERANICTILIVQLQRVESRYSALVAAEKYSISIFKRHPCTTVFTVIMATPGNVYAKLANGFLHVFRLAIISKNAYKSSLGTELLGKYAEVQRIAPRIHCFNMHIFIYYIIANT
ncbi:hypothetical protein D3C76_1529310 [compost metagenome]